MIEDPTDSESEAIEELYEGDDDDAEVDEAGDPALTPGEAAEDEEADDVCVSDCSDDGANS
jgi:hypothetical protein